MVNKAVEVIIVALSVFVVYLPMPPRCVVTVGSLCGCRKGQQML